MTRRQETSKPQLSFKYKSKYPNQSPFSNTYHCLQEDEGEFRRNNPEERRWQRAMTQSKLLLEREG